MGETINYDEEKVGATISLSENSKVSGKGFGLSYLHRSLDFEEDKGKSKIDRFAFNYSNRFIKNSLGVEYNLGAGLNFHEYNRNINFTSPQRIAESSFYSFDTLAEIELFKNYKYDNLIIAPYIGLSSGSVHKENFTEKNANSLNASLSSDTAFSLRPKIGISSETELFNRDNQSITLDSSIEYSSELGNIATKNDKISLKGFSGHLYLDDPYKEKSTFSINTDLKYKYNNLELSVGYSDDEHSQDLVTNGFKINW